MPTVAELAEELTPKQRILVDRLKEARMMRKASHDAYCRAIESCTKQGVSFGIMAHEIGELSKEAIWRQYKRWAGREV